ncbi:hypothetical protein DH2020_046062 [Rehmannia glutinosa]|uniref:Heparan-alpha-glucosaminide N-acetyltransferase catalytic domain-containing protein n=1 Tax=Rehmannia glutinosa TaxID=99300 RepID=A0ABR0UCF7_REHGL
MASITVVTDTDGERTPLLRDSQPVFSGGVSEYYSPPSAEEPLPKNSKDPKQRLVSLDLMILVDDAGKAFPSINHAPWFGVTLADFVMPFFLFGVGVSVSLVFKNVANRLAATKKVILRFIKLFLLGVILQGGYFHGHDNLTYGVDVTKIRVMGVLQRIAIGYLLASGLEIWLVKSSVVNSAGAFVKRYSFQIGAGILLGSLYMVLLYGLYVPNWAFDVSSLSMILPSSLGATAKTVSQSEELQEQFHGKDFVHCALRGSLKPPCNAVGFIDRILLGEKHLVNSPDYGPLPPNSPAWCLAPFDPEGILSELPTRLVWMVTKFSLSSVRSLPGYITLWPSLPLFYFLVTDSFQLGPDAFRVMFWFFVLSLKSLISGYLLFSEVDVKCIRKPTVIFQWMGMNALIVYALAACDIFPAALQGFYWRSPENNLVII